ncbi:MAG TPA: cupin domain-containing protein [Bacilli bacterium]|nr:cupin domain-containing protein [Bacilli bacterium]
MITNFDHNKEQKVLNMRGGEGYVWIEKLEPCLAHMKMYAKITIPAGSSIGLHVHEADEEVVYVLSGKGEVTMGSTKKLIDEGTVNITKQNESHSIKNIFSEDLVLLAVINEI